MIQYAILYQDKEHGYYGFKRLDHEGETYSFGERYKAFAYAGEKGWRLVDVIDNRAYTQYYFQRKVKS